MSKDLQKHALACGKAAGRPRNSEIEARMHMLIHTAGALFLEHGYSKVSLETIAREAHVAVRTIYVKFGGKAGLLKAVLVHNRDQFFKLDEMETDPRPFKEIVGDFGLHFHHLITAPEALSMQRMVAAEARANPELAHTYFDAGPKQVREMLARFFARPDIRVQLRGEAPIDLLPMHLLNCVMGDFFSRFLFEGAQPGREECLRTLAQRLDLFYHAVLRAP